MFAGIVLLICFSPAILLSPDRLHGAGNWQGRPRRISRYKAPKVVAKTVAIQPATEDGLTEEQRIIREGFENQVHTLEDGTQILKEAADTETADSGRLSHGELNHFFATHAKERLSGNSENPVDIKMLIETYRKNPEILMEILRSQYGHDLRGKATAEQLEQDQEGGILKSIVPVRHDASGTGAAAATSSTSTATASVTGLAASESWCSFPSRCMELGLDRFMRTGEWWVKNSSQPSWSLLLKDGLPMVPDTGASKDTNQRIYQARWINELFKGEDDVGPGADKIKFVPQVRHHIHSHSRRQLGHTR
jgi:hypothetical protein